MTRWTSSSRCGFASLSGVVVIRSASTADAAQIAAVMRDSWFAGYDGIIAPAVIDRATAPDGGARIRQSFRTRPWQRMIAAVARGPAPQAHPHRRLRVLRARTGRGGHALAVSADPGRLGGRDRLNSTRCYLAPGLVVNRHRASAHGPGSGQGPRGRVRVASRCGCSRPTPARGASTQRAGFAPDGARHVLDDLGGITEIRYRRALSAFSDTS